MPQNRIIPAMRRIGLIIFDCDGVLVDSEPLATRVLVRMANRLELNLTEEEALPLFRGGKMADCVAEIERRLGKSVPDSFVPDVRRRMAEAFRRELRLVDGIEDVLDSLTIPVCVASSGPTEKIRLSLEITGLLPRFGHAIFSAYEVGVWKPDPGLFLHAALRMGVSPDACAVVEDSVPGVRAGVAAGMLVFGFAGGASSEELGAAGAIPFESMADLPRLLSANAFLQ